MHTADKMTESQKCIQQVQWVFSPFLYPTFSRVFTPDKMGLNFSAPPKIGRKFSVLPTLGVQ